MGAADGSQPGKKLTAEQFRAQIARGYVAVEIIRPEFPRL